MRVGKFQICGLRYPPDHHWHPADIWLGGDQIEKPDHRRLRIQKAFVHIDIDDLRAVLDLLTCNIQRSIEIALGNQLAELG